MCYASGYLYGIDQIIITRVPPVWPSIYPLRVAIVDDSDHITKPFTIPISFKGVKIPTVDVGVWPYLL